MNADLPKPPKRPTPSCPSLDDLALFARIAQLGNLSAVARELGVPVSQVSRRLQRIESACAARLVHRSTHGLSLTPEGEQVQQAAEQIAACWDDVSNRLHQLRSPVHGVAGLVRVAASANVADHLLVPSLPGLHQRHPALRVDLRVDDRLVDMAQEGIDIAIRTGTPAHDTWIVRPLGHLSRRLYASPAYARAHGLPRNGHELAQHRLITHSSHAMLNRWGVGDAALGESAPGSARGAPRTAVQMQGHWLADNSSTLVSMALAGLGIARIPSLVGAALVRDGRLVEVMAEWDTDSGLPVNAVMLAQRHRLPKVKACVDYWAGWFGALADTAKTPFAA